jgi:hypothetical protein
MPRIIVRQKPDTICPAATAELYFDGELIDSLTIPSGGTDSFSIDCNTLVNAVRVEALGGVGHSHGGTFVLNGEVNGKDSYVKNDDPDRIIYYDGTRWVLEKLGGGAHTHEAALGNEDYPWQADWTLENLNVFQATIGTYCANGASCEDATWTLLDTDGNVLDSGIIASGGSDTITAPNATVENSDATYTDTVASGGALVLPDTDIEVNGVNEGSVPSVNTIDFQLTDGVNPVTPDSVTVVGNVVTVEVPAAPMPDPAGEFLTATGITDVTITTAIYNLVDDLQTGGIWNKIEAFYPFVGGSAATHKFNLKDPRDKDIAFRLNFFGGVTHDANGVTGNGTNAYFRTFFSCNTTNKRDTNLGFIYSRTNSQSGSDFGQIFESGFQLNSRNTSDLFFVRNSSATQDTQANSDSRGFFGITRDNSSNFRMYIGTTEYTKTRASAGNGLGVDILGLALQVNAGTISDYSNRNIAAMGFGESLSTSEMAALKTAIDNFQTTLGRQV